MSDFQKGDLVRRIDCDNSKDMTIGTEWVVDRALPDNQWMRVKGYNQAVLRRRFELVKPVAAPKAQYLVQITARQDGLGMYDTLEKAIEMAVYFNSKRIYEVTAVHHVETKTEWVRKEL